MANNSPFSGDEIPLDSHFIEIRIRNLSQLFDSRDPSPFLAKDLDDDAQQYIVASAGESSSRLPLALAIHLTEPVESPEVTRDAGEAIREHFKRQSGFTSLRLRELLHDGWISLAIGLTFLSLALAASATLAQWTEAHPWLNVFREGLIICGWVAMWHPLQILLYDWWPILGDRRMFDRLARMPVQFICQPPARHPPAPGS